MTENEVVETLTEPTSHKEAVAKIVVAAIVGYVSSELSKKAFDAGMAYIRNRRLTSVL